MPHPLILLEQHNSSAARRFIIDNVKELKEIGYRSFLLEITSEMSPDQFKHQLSIYLSNMPNNHPLHLITTALYDMLLALEYNNIPYKFIDPETQQTLLLLRMERKNALTDEQKSSVHAKREYLTAKRDEIMAPIIQQEAESNQGGVLFLGGYKHKTLVKLLEASKSQFYRYAIFNNSQEDSQIPKSRFTEERKKWSMICSSHLYRNEFYKAAVNYFDIATNNLPFKIIAMLCGLTEKIPCKTPTVGKYFSIATEQKYSYSADAHLVVTATAKFETKQKFEETRNVIRKKFPGLFFSVKKDQSQIFLDVPGLNLLENSEVLASGFTQLGIMKQR